MLRWREIDRIVRLRVDSIQYESMIRDHCFACDPKGFVGLPARFLYLHGPADDPVCRAAFLSTSVPIVSLRGTTGSRGLRRRYERGHARLSSAGRRVSRPLLAIL